ncbi:MAG: acyltransferase family protein [Sulfuricurvum sp.]|nr:acyltransferase family protein [Sulfuricurvum sp.]
MQQNTSLAPSVWNETLNAIKAILIFLVVIGHLMSGGNELTRLIKEVLSGFRMPLFFGISGFLIKKALFTASASELGNKYYHRIIIPYALAFIVYSIVNLSIINPLYPSNHMWFIPAFLLMIVYIFFIERFNINRLAVLIFAAIFTMPWLAFVHPGSGDEIAYYLGDKRYYYYFVFFYFGYMLRNYSEKLYIPKFIYIFILMTSGYLLFVNNTSAANYLYSINSLLFNLSLILVVIKFAQKYTSLKIPIISDLGSYTLPIYLWHMLPLFLMWKIRDTYHINGFIYLFSYFILLSLLIYIIVKSKDTLFGKIFITGAHK